MKEKSTKILYDIYNWLNEHMAKNYWGMCKLKWGEESSCKLSECHSQYAHITIASSSMDKERDLFLSIFHEYMHLVLAPIGMLIRYKMLEMKDVPLLPYIAIDSEESEEGVIYALESTLGEYLYKQWSRTT